MNQSRDDGKKTRVPVPEAAERFQVRRSIAGWVLVPHDPEHHPLLASLFGPADDGTPAGERMRFEDRKSLQWDSLQDGLQRIRNTARELNLAVRFCGDLKRHPTALLWRLPPPRPLPEPLRPFKELRGDAAKWGVSDFYEAHELALKEALATRQPFDTGWYAVKKEIQSARIWRGRAGGPVLLQVSASMDDWPDLVDTALWSAWGKRLEADSGYDVLVKLGLSEQEAQAWLDELVDSESSNACLGEDNSITRVAQCAGNIAFRGLCQRLDVLADSAEEELKSVYAGLVEHCAWRLSQLKASREASCFNCRFFHAGIPESRSHPADPAECGHPRYFALLTANKAFPFVNGCKFWQAKPHKK